MLCRAAAPSVRSSLRETLDKVQEKRHNLELLGSRGDVARYQSPRESIANHCNELRSAVNELESRLLSDVDFYMREAVGVADGIRGEIDALENFQQQCESYESYGAVDLCVLMSTVKIYESSLHLPKKKKTNGTLKDKTKDQDDSLGLDLSLGPKLLKNIRDSGHVYIARPVTTYEVRCTFFWLRLLFRLCFPHLLFVFSPHLLRDLLVIGTLRQTLQGEHLFQCRVIQ
jgi:hypothetical protein